MPRNEDAVEASGTLNNLGRAVLSVNHWKTRIVLWTAGAAVGGSAVLFAWVADLAQGLFMHIAAASVLWAWLLAPLGFMVVAWVTRTYFRGTEGSGIPQTIFVLRPEATEAAASLLHPRVAVGRVLLAGAGLLCGGSIGREGPSVHVGAVVAHSLARWLPHGGTQAQRRALVLAGGAAGVAAAFNTPLAGIVFAIEELARSFEERASGAALTAVILAGVIAIALVGDYTYFGQPVVSDAARELSPGVLLVALVGGLAGGLFSRTLLAARRGLPSVLGQVQRQRPAVFAALCGLAVAAAGTGLGGLTYGTGYTQARQILESGVHLSWAYAPGRAFATLAAFLSGIPAGLMAPSLSVGAGLGQMVADAVHQPSAVPYAILGMCAYLAGVTQAPLTSFVIVMEMTMQHGMVLPLMVSAAAATGVSRLLTSPLYQTLASGYGERASLQ